jgi:hypothetical protein
LGEDLERAIDELYGLPPAEFVAARDELAGRMKKAGDKEEAGRVKALRRPTVPAWAVNQLLRAQPEGIDELLRTGEDLRKAQRRALSGAGAGGFREAATRRRSLVSRLTDQTLEILEGRGIGSGPHRDAVAATLEAASSDDAAADQVRSGRLVKELTPPTEFGAFSPLTVMPSPRERKESGGERAAPVGRGAKKAAKPSAEEKAAAAEAQAQAARDEARIKAREAQSADRRSERARGEAERADAEASRLEERARQSRERHRFLAERAKAAEQEAADARKQADQAARRVRQLSGRTARST